MRTVVAMALAALLLTSCVAQELEPIPGSITYSGQPRTKLTKSPVGSTLNHYFYGPFGERIQETYVIQPDRSLKLVARERQDIFSALYD
ncbi:hypothetical protein QO002_002853 [Pararhizobium capsulatum DSM 1112]|uniref:Transmembrane protein n=1 Tax=Pararhizobium capsulatum DSM 1112 TaxID=1121113 RepID=A0ABU0BR45_9HYPH|nr:hypothetical protein [Pararhizobium capsulatum DSM 1112]